MSKSSFKKISAAAVVAVLSVTGLSHAATLAPYSTSFETTPDSLGATYTSGAGLAGTNGWVNENGEAASGATISNAKANTGSQSVLLSTTSGEGFTDIYNSNLGDHQGTSTTVAGTVNISFAMNHTYGSSGDQFGMDILDGSDNVIATLRAGKGDETNPGPLNDLIVNNGGSDATTTVNGAAGQGKADGAWGTYHISLNFDTKTFTVFVDGNSASATYAFNSAAVSQEAISGDTIGGIAFAGVGSGGGGSAYFDDLTVVPEPASIAMVGLGGLVLLARRPKRQV